MEADGCRNKRGGSCGPGSGQYVRSRVAVDDQDPAWVGEEVDQQLSATHAPDLQRQSKPGI